MLEPSIAEKLAYANHLGEIVDDRGFTWRMQTAPQLLRDGRGRWGGNKPALRKKRYGIWNTITWNEYYENVKYASLGLISLGFEWGDTIAIIGDNDPEYWYCQLAAQAAGGAGAGMFVDCIPSEIEYYVTNSDSVFVAAKDQEQCDKLLEIKGRLPQVKKVIYWEPKGMWKYDDPWLMDFGRLIQLGREHEKMDPDLFEENVGRGRVDDIAALGYTSGTTGMPKGVPLTYRGLISWGCLVWHNFPCYEGDDYVSFLSPAWGIDQSFGIAVPLEQGLVVNFSESPSTLPQDAREISPAIELAGARMWEERYRNIQMQLADVDWLKNLCYKLALPIGYRYTECMKELKGPSSFWRWLKMVADVIALRAMKDKFGYNKARVCLVAGAMLSADLFRYFQAIGIPLYTYFGAGEVGFVSSQNPRQAKVGTTGPMLPGINVRLSEAGELLIKKEGNPMFFLGYHKNEKATREKVKNGWYHTGDAAHIDEEGNLIFIDRMDEMMSLRSGVTFSPTFIETQLRFSKYIRDAIAFGDGRDTAAVLLEIDLKNVGKWAEEHHVSYMTFADLSQKSQVYDLMLEEIKAINTKLPEASRIKAYANLHKEFDPDEAELTRTRKLKRKILEDKYGDIVEAIYSGTKEVKVRTEVKYRDGRTGTVEAIIHPRFLEEKARDAGT